MPVTSTGRESASQALVRWEKTSWLSLQRWTLGGKHPRQFFLSFFFFFFFFFFNGRWSNWVTKGEDQDQEKNLVENSPSSNEENSERAHQLEKRRKKKKKRCKTKRRKRLVTTSHSPLFPVSPQVALETARGCHDTRGSAHIYRKHHVLLCSTRASTPT